MISPRDGPCDQVFVGNEMGNLYALRDLDGDGRVFGDQEATGVQRATGNGDEMVVFYGMKWCFLFFSDEIMFLFFVRNWWIYVRNWWFLLGSSREKGEQMMVLCTKWDDILISYSHTVINMIEATRWFPICAEENKIINVLFPLPDWIIVVLPTFYNQ